MATASFRAFPLDGAMSWFQPSTGAHVRWDGPETHALARVAPRVVMFSLSHACNLACGFCSRDAGLATSWTADSAANLLRELAARRVLEVSLGGGEPLAFRGLERLLDRLHDETPLAVHLTTNGVLLDEARVARLRGRVGEVRVSVPTELLRQGEVLISGADEWQVFYFRNNSWTSPLSSAADGAAGNSSQPPLPDGVRLILTLTPGQAVSGRLTRDWVRPTLGPGGS